MRLSLNLAVTFTCLTHLVFVFGQQTGAAGRSNILFPEDEPNVSTEEAIPNASTESHAERCTTPDGLPGRCIVYDNCPRFMTPRLNFEELRRYLCGFSGQVPHVCCPPQVETTRGLNQQPMIGSSNRPANLPADCGRTNASHNRIVNGEEAEPGAWPWLAALFIEERGIRSAECGGALISSRYVVTAAHCVTGNGGSLLSPRRLSVRLGDHHLFWTNDTATSVDMNVMSVIRHPQFQHRTFLNDIALLKLQENVTMNGFVHPICLPYDPPIRTDDLQDKKAFVAGWGTTSFDGPSSPVVRQVQLPLWNETACRHAYRNDVNLTSAYLCAGLADGGKDACQGDSGGPLMLPVNPSRRFHLVGIVSFGKQCAQANFPGVYTNVRQYLSWISQNID